MTGKIKIKKNAKGEMIFFFAGIEFNSISANCFPMHSEVCFKEQIWRIKFIWKPDGKGFVYFSPKKNMGKYSPEKYKNLLSKDFSPGELTIPETEIFERIIKRQESQSV